MSNLHKLRQVVVCAALVALTVVITARYAMAHDLARYRPGVRNAPAEQRLTREQLNLIAQSLRAHTGWQSLYFDEDGFLICPDPQAFSGGSAAARKLLGAALTDEAAYELESHHRSGEVKFGRISAGTEHVDHKTSLKISIRHVQIDFTDFRQLHGEPLALRAFDPGIAVLHELAHGVWRLPDARSAADEPGECERYINQIRRELHLPERQHYSAGARSRANRAQLVAELRFIRFREKHGQLRREHFFLRWDAELVGALDATNVTAFMR
ncbi:MAG: hypothetical protein HOP19_11515 [Acidobacteria bacterium]|nr:hypothetical protein [Acidobacteriota bacterium]